MSKAWNIHLDLHKQPEEPQFGLSCLDTDLLLLRSFLSRNAKLWKTLPPKGKFTSKVVTPKLQTSDFSLAVQRNKFSYFFFFFLRMSLRMRISQQKKCYFFFTGAIHFKGPVSLIIWIFSWVVMSKTRLRPKSDTLRSREWEIVRRIPKNISEKLSPSHCNHNLAAHFLPPNLYFLYPKKSQTNVKHVNLYGKP